MKFLNMKQLCSSLVIAAIFATVPSTWAESDGEIAAQDEARTAEKEVREAAEEVRVEVRQAIDEARAVAQEAAEGAREAVRSWSWNWESEDAESSNEPEPYVGVTIESVPRALRRYLDLPKGVGLLLVKIHKDSPAEAAGLQDDDILVEFNHQMIINFEQFSTLVNMLSAGDKVPVVVIRKGARVALDLVIEKRVRKGSRWIVPPEAPVPPVAPVAPIGYRPVHPSEDVVEVTTPLTDSIPRVVRFMAEDGEAREIDLSQLKSNLGNLEAQFRNLEIGHDGKEVNVQTLLDRLGDLQTVIVGSPAEGPRQSIVHMGETTLSLHNEDGKVRIYQEGEESKALVTAPDGVVLFDGAIPADIQASDLDPRAKRLIQSLLDMSENVDFDLQSSTDMSVDLEVVEANKST